MRTGAVIAVLLAGAMAMVPGASAQVYGNDNLYIQTPQNALMNATSRVKAQFRGVDVRRIEAPDTVSVGQVLHFHADMNIGGATLPVTTRWEFGDGETGSGICAEHAYAKPGRYTVRFHLVNHRSADTEERTITVVP